MSVPRSIDPRKVVRSMSVNLRPMSGNLPPMSGKMVLRPQSVPKLVPRTRKGVKKYPLRPPESQKIDKISIIPYRNEIFSLFFLIMPPPAISKMHDI